MARDYSNLPRLARLMETVLIGHDHKPDWIDEELHHLIDGYYEEKDEFNRAVIRLNSMRRLRDQGKEVNVDFDHLEQRVVAEGIDLANRIFFIVDQIWRKSE